MFNVLVFLAIKIGNEIGSFGKLKVCACVCVIARVRLRELYN